jgi:hypothetical protein
MAVTTMRLPTIGCVPISLTVLKCYLSISLTMEKKSTEVERWLLADTDYRRCIEVPSTKPLKLTAEPVSATDPWSCSGFPGVGRPW